MNKKNQAGGHHTPQGGNKSGSSGEDKAGQQNQQSGSDGSRSQADADKAPNPNAERAGSHEPRANQAGK